MKTIKISLLIATVTVSLFALTAKGDTIVTYNGTNYDISVVTGKFNDYSAELESTPWWGNSTLAENLKFVLPIIDQGWLAYAWGTTDSGATVLVGDGSDSADDPGGYYALGTASPVVSPVPEPSMFWMFGIGALGLGGYAWRKKKRTA